MQRYPFIFSDERKYRFWRHFVFWACWWVFQVFLYGYVPILTGLMARDRIILSLIESTLYLFPHMFMAYTLMYFVIPRFIVKGEYLTAALLVVCICILAALFSATIGHYILDGLRKRMYPEWGEWLKRLSASSIWLSLLAGLRGGITIGGMAAAIKLMKHWYVKEQRNLQLQKENTESQLQILKAQVHPHFLFNTLNNIYSHTQDTSPTASKLVMGLGDMLRYMLYECNQPLVPLEKELQMIQDYVTLEKIRYGNRLEVQLDLPLETASLMIAPLLMLPLVENCFKHGASHMLDQPWISIHVTIENRMMKMKLVNGKAIDRRPAKSLSGIGIQNVRKRLDLIYPNKYFLDIQEEEEVFIVNLKLELERARITKESKTPVLTTVDA